MQHANANKLGKACKHNQVLPYVRVRVRLIHALLGANANANAIEVTKNTSLIPICIRIPRAWNLILSQGNFNR